MDNCEKCICGNNPSINQNEFTFEILEYGCLDNTLILEKIATCRKCGEIFKFSITKD